MRTSDGRKGLRDIRTAISTHHRTASPHKGTPYLEILALGMERLRLETELGQHRQRVWRVERRLGEIRACLEVRVASIRDARPGGAEGGPASGGFAGGAGCLPARMTTMMADY